MPARALEAGGHGCPTTWMYLRPLDLFSQKREGRRAQGPSLHKATQLPCHPRRDVLRSKPFAPRSCPATLPGPSPSITPSPLSSSIFPEACPLIRQPRRRRHGPPLVHLSQPTHSSLATCRHLRSPPALPKPRPNHPPSLERHWRVRQVP